MPANRRIKPVTYGLMIYLMLSSLDAWNIHGTGSFLKILAFLPLALMLPDLKSLRLRPNRLLALQLCFWFLAMLSVFYSVSVDRTFSVGKTLTLNLILVFAFGALVPYNRKELELLQKALLWGCWIHICLTLIFADISAAGRLTLGFGDSVQDQNNNNTYMLYAFSYHAHQFLYRRGRGHILPITAILTMVLLSGSRGALLAYTVVLLFHIQYFYRNDKNALRKFWVTVLLLLLLGIAADLIVDKMPESITVRYSWAYLKDKGTSGRARIWTHLWNVFSESEILRMLFGHGYGTTRLVNQYNHLVAHNLYLDNLITLGIAGMTLQIASQGTVLWIFRKRRKVILMGAYLGMITMCMSLSLTASKPMWNMMMIAMALDCCEGNMAYD